MTALALVTLATALAAGGGFNDKAVGESRGKDARAEAAAAELLKEQLKATSPDDLKLLESVTNKEIVVVSGSMDHIEDVLKAAGIRHTVITPEAVAQADLRAHQIVMVNCPGVMPDASVRRIERFVRAGGLLYTTDWALTNVVAKAFPNTIAHNGQSTSDHVVPVTVAAHQHGKHGDIMSDLLLSKRGAPQWWLEGSSYPMAILNKNKVEVLADSAEMKRLYGSSPVVARVRWEDGQIIHVVSHFYRQVGTNGATVATAAALNEVDSLSASQKAKLSKSNGDVPWAEVESSYAFQRMTSNIVTGKMKANEQLDKSYTMTNPAPVALEGGVTTAPRSKLKPLEKKAGKVRVRDDAGNEGWVAEDALTAR